jgi:hypothetical protein
MRFAQKFSGRQIEEIYTNVSWVGRQMRYSIFKNFSGRQMRCTQKFSGRQIEEIYTTVSWAGRQMRYLQKLLR